MKLTACFWLSDNCSFLWVRHQTDKPNGQGSCLLTGVSHMQITLYTAGFEYETLSMALCLDLLVASWWYSCGSQGEGSTTPLSSFNSTSVHHEMRDLPLLHTVDVLAQLRESKQLWVEPGKLRASPWGWLLGFVIVTRKVSNALPESWGRKPDGEMWECYQRVEGEPLSRESQNLTGKCWAKTK